MSAKKTKLDRAQVELKKGSIWTRLPMIGLAMSVCLVAAWAIGGRTGEEHEIAKFWTAYNTAFMFTLALGLGGFIFVVIQHLVRAGWSIVVRRLAEHALFTLPFVALMGLPILFVGDHYLFSWTHVEHMAHDPMLQAKVAYLNETAFSLRFAIYVVIWAGFALWFWYWSTEQDNATDKKVIKTHSHRMRWVAPFGLLAFAGSMSFGAFDFMMSLDPHWFSTIFGVYYFAGIALTFHSFLVIVCFLLQRTGYLKGVVTPEHYHDLGKFMFGFTVFWTYIGFSQYFLIWYANIPEETYFFEYRGHGDWMVLSLLLVFGRFVIPFFALLRRPVKRNPNILVWIAVWIVAMEYIDMFWLIQPPYAHHAAHNLEAAGKHELADWFTNHVPISGTYGLMDALCLVGFLGVFLVFFGWSLARRPLVPVNDPRLQESLDHENF